MILVKTYVLPLSLWEAALDLVALMYEGTFSSSVPPNLLFGVGRFVVFLAPASVLLRLKVALEYRSSTFVGNE